MSQASAVGPLLERTEELGRIASALADARAGRGTFPVKLALDSREQLAAALEVGGKAPAQSEQR